MSGRKINLIDTTLRDGSHAVSHSFTVEQVKAIAGGLDRAGVDFIKLSHGDGIIKSGRTGILERYSIVCA